MVLETFLKYGLADLPLIFVDFVCMGLILALFLPKKTKGKFWLSLISIELFEHIIFPLILVILLLKTEGIITGIIFHASILLFCFGFIGLVIAKARTAEQWFKIVLITAFTYFFIFTFPAVLIYLQYQYGLLGYYILGTTIVIFLSFYLFMRKRAYNKIAATANPIDI